MKMKEAYKVVFKKREVNPEMIGKVELEKNDLLALVLATASVIVPVLLIVFAVIALIIFIMFYR
ncbi:MULTISPECIES: hypothetical protein [Clostridium]|uniref:Uncharacterized protein n=1 Tax=Clostridium sulfidigenes TaxID=318464 RepID=A0A084J9W6_9CLOT|nr:hypothetical protein [Clostridium sulfidigenes]KEZ85750.1 hypothetical protein IO99_12630 [Clostridium sulfidigenes]HAR84414.1 hypothetical protein [Clostridium sp.]HBL06167.1 hypothetical protein [Clostridium sp.]HCO74956.1 hypothetical protein [Clostridium sp.]